jgi:hypothetical protein
VTAQQINDKVDLAVSAQESGDFAAALAYLRSAWLGLAGLPDSTSPESGLRWDRQAISAMMAELRKAQAAARSGSVQRTKINYVQPDSEEEE